MTDEVQEEDYESPAEHPPCKVIDVRYMEGETPANTEKSTAWAVKARNKQHLDDPCPENVFC